MEVALAPEDPPAVAGSDRAIVAVKRPEICAGLFRLLLFFVFLQQLFKLFVKRGILLCGILLCLFRGIFVALELLYQLLGFLQLAVKIRL